MPRAEPHGHLCACSQCQFLEGQAEAAADEQWRDQPGDWK